MEALIKSTVAVLTIKRIPDNEIIKNIFDQTNKTISKQALCGIRNKIKRHSFNWYKSMREGEYEYIHEFRANKRDTISAEKASSDCNEKRRQLADTTDFLGRIASLNY